MRQSKVLLIYTGGTIGMIEDPETGVLTAFDFDNLSSQIPELHRINADLKVISLETPIDSSDMNPSIWQKIAQLIADNYVLFDGFVVLHGTDTMAYTASALSFILQGLEKPIILTGSQLPIGVIRTDGKENLITSIEIAAQKDENGESIVQEVAIYFEYSLYRGNRTTKVSANAFEAFLSPNYSELAKAGIEIKYDSSSLWRNQVNTLFFQAKMESRIALLKIFPGGTTSIYKSLFDINLIKAIIIESFGTGNIPDDKVLIGMIEDYIDSGGIVINITQCSSGSVSQGKYANSTILNKIGVISGKDLTTEAALTKTMFLMGNYSSRQRVKELIQVNLVGEISE